MNQYTANYTTTGDIFDSMVIGSLTDTTPVIFDATTPIVHITPKFIAMVSRLWRYQLTMRRYHHVLRLKTKFYYNP